MRLHPSTFKALYTLWLKTGDGFDLAPPPDGDSDRFRPARHYVEASDMHESVEFETLVASRLAEYLTRTDPQTKVVYAVYRVTERGALRLLNPFQLFVNEVHET